MNRQGHIHLDEFEDRVPRLDIEAESMEHMVSILYQFCTYDRTGICEAENFKEVIPDKCRFCEVRRECPVEKGGECVREEEA